MERGHIITNLTHFGVPNGALQALLIFWLVGTSASHCASLDAPGIIKRSVEVNQNDWIAAPDYSFRETDRDTRGSKTFRVSMIDGSPYQTLLAVNGIPLTSAETAKQQSIEREEVTRRRAESTQARERRVRKYQTERSRDHLLMQQLTDAFVFRLVSERKVGAFQTYYLRAIPRKGYNPPNMESQVLPGMQGELWVDKESFQWVKVSARVNKPVSIAGFLAEVEPGTYFQLENMPVAPGIWLPKHYQMKSRSKILYFIGHNTQADETYSEYRREPR